MTVQTKFGVAELREAVTELTVPGLERDYTFIHVTDLHFACHEEGDSPEAVELANARNEFWSYQPGFFAKDDSGRDVRIMPDEGCEILAEHIRGMDSVDGVFFTGDTVDYPSVANFRRAKRFLDSLDKPCYIVPGNHDFVGDDAPEDMSKAFYELMGEMRDSFVCPLDGVDIVGFADGFVKVTDEQVAFLEERIAAGRPMIVLLHAPVFAERAKTVVYPFWGYNWMVGDTGRPEGKQTDANFKFRELLCRHRDLVTVFAGHVHMASGDGEAPAEGEVLQYTTAAAFAGNYRVIRLKRG